MISSVNRLYRKLFCRGGYGIHSPFVYDLITSVIEEKKRYYCYEQYNLVRLQLMQDKRKVTVRNRTMSIKKAIETCCFTEAENRLLFRLANRFQPETILLVGSNFGLTPLHLTAYSKDSTCVVVEPEPSIAAIANDYLEKYALASIVLRNSLIDIPERLDFVVWSYPIDSIPLEPFLSYMNVNSVMVVYGINDSQNNKERWRQICIHPQVTVTIDFLRIGIVFFNPRYHQKTYKSIVLN